MRASMAYLVPYFFSRKVTAVQSYSTLCTFHLGTTTAPAQATPRAITGSHFRFSAFLHENTGVWSVASLPASLRAAPPQFLAQWESAMRFLMWAMALPGLRCLGHVLEQFMMVWQR